MTYPPRVALGASLGLLISVFDVWFLGRLGVEARVAGADATWILFAFFAATYTGLGAVCAGLWVARANLQAEAEALRRAHQSLEDTQAELARAEHLAALGRMAAGVAHEVKNPLGVLRASAGLVAEDVPAGSDAARACSFIVAEVDRLDTFVRRVLDFARPLEARAEPLSTDELLAELARRRGVPVEGTAGVVVGDRTLLSAALEPLVDNALRWRAAAAQLRAGADGERRWIEVADDGPGVAAGDRARLFEPFFTRRPDGTGLGLATAARLVAALGGRLKYREGAGLGPAGAGACLRLELA